MAKTRKCDYCKTNINIKDKTNLGHLLKYKDKFYHKDCFITLAESRVAANNRYSASWQEALDNIDVLVEAARQSIVVKVKTDPLNEYLIETYGVATLPSRFWSMVADINNGIYKRKRCKPIDYETLLEMWKHYQKKLNDACTYNKMRGNEMTGEDRVFYDLAIIMGSYSEFVKMKAKEEANSAEIKKEKTTNRIDYDVLYKQTSSSNQKTENDILSLMEDIF